MSHDNELPNGRWEAFIQLKYILSTRFLRNGIFWLDIVPFLLPNILNFLNVFFVPPLQHLTPTLCRHNFHRLKYLKIYWNLTAINKMIICEGGGD
jgi:hypothetical protein